MSKNTTLQQIQSAIQSGDLTCVELVNTYLAQIQKTSDLNAYIEVFEEEAIAKAKALDTKYKNDPTSVGKLFGMVVSIKDVLCYKDHQVTGASKILEDFTSLYSATAIERIVNEDAIIIGRVNCDQFGMGSTNENSVYGVTKNGIDPTKVPGGSSGGSAVSVQMDTCLVSLGTDTGGSVRQPAGFCGVIGLKPTYGRISRYGLLAYASSFDQIGIISKSVENIATILEVMAGADEFDSTVSSKLVPNYIQELDFDTNKKVKIAYFDTALNHPSIDPEIKDQTTQLIEKIKGEGHTVEAVPFEYLDYIIPAYYVLTTAEASSNLSRYDGIRYGHRSKAATNLEETYKMSRTEGFSTEVKRRIMLGTFVLSAGYYDAYYGKAQKVRRLIQDRTNEILNDYDFILMPVAPTTAWDLGQSLEDPVAMYLADIFTVQANMTGMPAIALPIGTHSSGLPIGVQLMNKHFGESELLSVSKHLINLLK